MEKFLFNEYPIKKHSSLMYALKKIGDTNIDIYGDYYEIFKLFNITDSKTNPKDLLDVIILNRKYIKTIISYLRNNINDIDIGRLLKYIEYRKNKPFTSNTEEVLILMYGEKKGLELFKEQQKKFSKYYTVEYYMGLGLSYDESILKIDDFKSKKSTNINNFIKKYGEIEGNIKYSDYVEKSKNTIETFKLRYGDKWFEKWSNYIKKDSSSYNYALKKASGDTEMAKIIFNNKLKKTTVNLNYLIEKHGEIEGSKKWNDMNTLKDSCSLNFFIKKCGDNEIAREKYVVSNKLKDSSSLNFFIKKYGEQGYNKYVEKCKKCDSNSFDFYMKKYKSVEIAKEKYIEGQIKTRVKILKASKSSLVYFQPLREFLVKNNILKSEEIYLGVDGSKEYFLRNKDMLFFYDFTIPNKKIIIEFNGKAWHPNWEKYGIEGCEKHFKNKKIKVDSAVEKEIRKINLAKENGFDVLILWEEDSVDFNKQKLYNYLNNKKIKYEN